MNVMSVNISSAIPLRGRAELLVSDSARAFLLKNSIETGSIINDTFEKVQNSAAAVNNKKIKSRMINSIKGRIWQTTGKKPRL